MSRLKQSVLCVGAIFVVLLIDRYTYFDLYLQNFFYDFEDGHWLVTKELHKGLLTWFFYDGFKAAVIVFGLCVLTTAVASFFVPKYRRRRLASLTVLLSLILVPGTVAVGKAVTNVYCPYELKMYGGKYPYVPVLARYPAGFVQTRRGRGFPAGHATSGFALMSLYFFYDDCRRRRMGLTFGLTAGWVTGMYQTLRGEHFISHTITSMLWAWVVILAVHGLLVVLDERASRKRADNTPLPR